MDRRAGMHAAIALHVALRGIDSALHSWPHCIHARALRACRGRICAVAAACEALSVAIRAADMCRGERCLSPTRRHARLLPLDRCEQGLASLAMYTLAWPYSYGPT